MERKAGILMPVFSLPSAYGIGDFGKSCYNFIDFLVSAKIKIWQILPLVQTGYGNSPYSSVSSKSFNPYFISPELLVEERLLTKEEAEFSKNSDKYIDYGFLYSVRFPLLRKAFERFDKNEKGFSEYVSGKKAYDYALFMTLKYASGQKHFYEWEEKYKKRDKNALTKLNKEYRNEVLFWQFVQYKCESQWLKVKQYANANGVEIIGDMPLYVALDSVDVWCNPELFKLDENFMPKKKAGVPPDYFCKEGQLWGNPVYDYSVFQKNNFKWWKDRLKSALGIYDFVRIDHFRGLDRFYEVEGNAENAMHGEWVKVPSKELFDSVHRSINRSRIIAEDLGIIDDGVRDLLKYTGYPGMKILSFAFNGEKDNLYLPQNIEENSVCYTGTHDNDTLTGLIRNFNEWDRNNLINGVKNSLIETETEGEVQTEDQIIESIIKLGFNSKAKFFIMPMQDILHYGSDYRINEPGTVKMQNWAVRLSESDFSKEIKNELNKLVAKYKR